MWESLITDSIHIYADRFQLDDGLGRPSSRKIPTGTDPKGRWLGRTERQRRQRQRQANADIFSINSDKSSLAVTLAKQICIYISLASHYSHKRLECNPVGVCVCAIAHTHTHLDSSILPRALPSARYDGAVHQYTM